MVLHRRTITLSARLFYNTLCFRNTAPPPAAIHHAPGQQLVDDEVRRAPPYPKDAAASTSTSAAWWRTDSLADRSVGDCESVIYPSAPAPWVWRAPLAAAAAAAAPSGAASALQGPGLWCPAVLALPKCRFVCDLVEPEEAAAEEEDDAPSPAQANVSTVDARSAPSPAAPFIVFPSAAYSVAGYGCHLLAARLVAAASAGMSVLIAGLAVGLVRRPLRFAGFSCVMHAVLDGCAGGG